MNIVVINGSPKGNNSITLQTVLYLQKHFSEHKFTVLNVGQKIKYYEKNINEALDIINKADLLLFSYPVYTFIAPYQLHRFIELLKESKVDLSTKFATQLTTSKHFYDVTAHKYIEENCYDLHLKYIKGISFDMDDLLTKKGQTQAIDFMKYVVFNYDNNIFNPLPYDIHSTNSATSTYEPKLNVSDKSNKKRVAIITNCESNDTNLSNMIQDFINVFPYETKLINIKNYKFSAGCLGCFGCAVTGKCVHKDGFDSFLRDEIQTCDATVYAFTIKDHSMGASFKIYADRPFCNGHRTVTTGMPIGYIISGNYQNESNLQMIIEGRADVGQNFLSSIATDENDTSTSILNLSKKLVFAMDNQVLFPQSFYGIGGMKIFRDLIYVMRGMMKADHKFYKEHKLYDFPQKQRGTILKMKLVGLLLSMPNARQKMGTKMDEAIINPYKSIIEKF